MLLLPVIASIWDWVWPLVIGAAVALGGGLAFSAPYRSPVTAAADTTRPIRPLCVPETSSMLI